MPSRIVTIAFDDLELRSLGVSDSHFNNWPVVYTIENDRAIYVGESHNVHNRMQNHLRNEDKLKEDLDTVRVILDEKFNKSACLDLESRLIALFAGDGKYRVLNRNDGVVDSDYYQRAEYSRQFEQIFEELRHLGLLTKSVPEIYNSQLFKYSPFKSLNIDQAIAIEAIMESLIDDLNRIEGRQSTAVLERVTDRPELDQSIISVVEGGPGTGKTIIAIYLLKLLVDIRDDRRQESINEETLFDDLFHPEISEILQGRRVGFVIPQQSLRQTVKNVFDKTPGLSGSMVFNPFEVAESSQHFDLLVVDEAHRLSQRSNQPSANLNIKFRESNVRLFDSDSPEYTQLDWILAKSKAAVLLLDPAQAVRPADLDLEVVHRTIETAKTDDRYWKLVSQMRVRAEDHYPQYVLDVLNGLNPAPKVFGRYDLRFFDHFPAMVRQIEHMEERYGLSRLVAGFGWEWVTKGSKDPIAYDIEIEGLRYPWNRTDKDWISSATSSQEIGSIHTVQGYDLNYAGVIIGPELYMDNAGRIRLDRTRYFDKRGKMNSPSRGLFYSDDEILDYVSNIYMILMTRGIMGTYVYVWDRRLRDYLKPYFSNGDSSTLMS